MRTTVSCVWLLVLLAGCTGAPDDGPPEEVSLAALVEEQERFDGRRVTTVGVVRSYPDPPHHWIEDVDLHRVELVPQGEVAPHLGDEIRVTGTFTFEDDRGRVIEVDEFEVVREGDVDTT